MTVIAQCSQRVMNYVRRMKVLKVHKRKHWQALCNLRGLGDSVTSLVYKRDTAHTIVHCTQSAGVEQWH